MSNAAPLAARSGRTCIGRSVVAAQQSPQHYPRGIVLVVVTGLRVLQVCVCFYLGSELLQHANNNKREGRSSTHVGCSLVSARARGSCVARVDRTDPTRHAPNHASPADYTVMAQPERFKLFRAALL